MPCRRRRTRELQLSEELDRATALIMGLQSENEAALDRERTTRHEAAAESQYAQQQQLNISRLTAANQVLQDRLRVMESRVLELDMVSKDDVQVSVSLRLSYLIFVLFSNNPKKGRMLPWKTD